MRRGRGIITLFVILLLLIAVAGGLMMGRPYIIDIQRQDAEAALFSMIESGQTEIDMENLPEMEGEQFSEMEALGDMFAEVADPQASSDTIQTEKKKIIGYGLIEIPAIELEMPLVKGADNYSLRAAIGWWPQSAPMGNAGNCAVFGHRMVTYGRHFNRLDELKQGDEVILYNMEGDRFVYVVTGAEVIEPGNLVDKLYEHSEGFQLTLVTCTPTGVGSQRLLVYAELDSSASGEE